MVEFAIALPVLILLVAGVLELGRGYVFAIATSDAARDGARYAAGKTSTTNGPGLAAMCSLITADLKAITSTVSCPTTRRPRATVHRRRRLHEADRRPGGRRRVLRGEPQLHRAR